MTPMPIILKQIRWIYVQHGNTQILVQLFIVIAANRCHVRCNTDCRIKEPQMLRWDYLEDGKAFPMATV